MKKLFLMCILATTLLSCKSFFYGVEPTFTMGMAESEFKLKNKPEMVSASEDGRRIYRTYNALTQYKFFVFKNDKLVRFENGTYPDDYKFLR